jgi:hypothetical protein
LGLDKDTETHKEDVECADDEQHPCGNESISAHAGRNETSATERRGWVGRGEGHALLSQYYSRNVNSEGTQPANTVVWTERREPDTVEIGNQWWRDLGEEQENKQEY